MMESYTTVKTSASYSFVEKKSEFIGYCAPVTSESESVAFVESIRKKHSDAKHNVYAYVLRSGFASRYSDDGEPHGTAGIPVLDAIRKAGVTDCAVVVTRYFGGILLGTGGLVRAYTAAAAGAIEAAGVAGVGLFSVTVMSMNYADYRRVLPAVTNFGAKIAGSCFAENVTLTVNVPAGSEERFASLVVDASNGRVIPRSVGEKYDFYD